MRPIQKAPFALAGLILALALCAGGVEEDPAAQWVTIFGWNQTGDRLAAASQWSLAQGSYMESYRQIKALAATHPDFEPELIAYRTGALQETIDAIEARLSADDHETMMTYLDFIESLELGQNQRSSKQFEAAHSTFDMAKSLLDEIIAKKPGEFRAAVDSQYQRLEVQIAWLSSQIDYKSASRAAVYVKEHDVQGTTRFVKVEDLPRAGEGAIASGILFPENLVASEPSEPEKPVPETKPASKGAMRFRMNTQEKSVAVGETRQEALR